MRASVLPVLALCLLAGACTTSWEPQYGPVPQVAAAHSGRTVRVVRKSDVSIVLQHVQVVGDSIVGEVGNPPQRVAIPMDDVQVITVPRRDDSLGKTAIVTGGTVLVALLAATVATLLIFDDWFDFQ